MNRRASVRLWLIVASCGGLCAAAPPTCKDQTIRGMDFENCERSDALCSVNPVTPLVRDQTDNPSGQWHGCWPAFISIAHFNPTPGVSLFSTDVSVVARFLDSERMDITITIEAPDHTRKTYIEKDVPVIIKNGIPTARAETMTVFHPLGVPTVEASERGGKKKAEHSYK